MVSDKEAAKIRTFVCGQLLNDPDLSTLTIGILKQQYLALVGREALSADARKFMKQVVEEELLKMQVGDSSGSELETETEPQKKRKREKENGNVCKSGSRAKKSRRQSSSSETEAREDCKSEGATSDEDKQIKSASGTGQQRERKTKRMSEEDKRSEESTDETNTPARLGKKVNESTCDDGPKEMVENGSKSAKSGKKRSSNRAEGKPSLRDEEKEAETESSSDGDGETGKISVEKKNDELAQDSDSSSSDSLEDEQKSEPVKKTNQQKKRTKKEERGKNRKSQKDTDNESDGSCEQHDSESDDGERGKISAGKKNDELAQDSDSSSSDSLEDERQSEHVKKTTKKEESGKNGKSQKGTDEESEGSRKHDESESDDSETKGDVSVRQKNKELVGDSDSSSLPSLEDERDRALKDKPVHKKKTIKKEESGKNPKSQKDDDKAVVRLKRYISLCGVRRNYKKLLDGCRSVRSMAAVLKKELEDLGVKGQPSIEKCKKVRLKREEAQELAELDVGNIITTQGRPTRRGASALEEHRASAPSMYQRTLNSSSDSDQDHTARRHRKATDWSNLQGIISDDADSN